MNAHIGKPFHPEELIFTLADAVQGKSTFKASPKPNAPGAYEALDMAVIERFRNDTDEQTLRLLIDTYLGDAAAQLDRLASLVRAGKPGEEAIRIAHSLKSASAMAGASAVSQLAASLEKALRQDPSAVDVAETTALKSHFAAYRAALADKGLAA